MRKGLVVYLFFLYSCSVGNGTGYFHGCLYYPECNEEKYTVPPQECAAENENYFLNPEFFAAETTSNGEIILKIQKSSEYMIQTDGLLIIVPCYEDLSRSLESQEYIDMVVPAQTEIASLPECSRVRVAYYLNDTCSGGEVSFGSGTGTLRIEEMYGGSSSVRENIKAEFDFLFCDPRTPPQGQTPSCLVLRGNFNFKYARGVPAQYYP
jgi:hypothetical protein